MDEEKLVTREQIDLANASVIAQNLNAAGHLVSEKEVVPTTAETGVEISGEDLSHIMGSSTTRTTNSRNFLGILLAKLKKKTGFNQEIKQV